MNLRTQALEYARNLGANFPFLRPGGTTSARFADRVAGELLGVDGDVPPEGVEEGVALVGGRERRRLVDAYASRFPDVWEILCRDIGRETAERELVESAVRAAVNERREPATLLVAALEDPRVPELSYHALAFVLAHDDVWSLDDAVTAAEAAAGRAIFPEAWEAAIASVARGRLEREHLERTRTLARRLQAHLPFAGFPRASALLARACELAAEDDEVATDLAVSLLRNYVVYLVGPPDASRNN